MIGLIHEAVDLGLTGLKMKCNRAGDTVKALQAIAADVPAGFRFTIDPMCAGAPCEAAALFAILVKLPFAIQIEDPFPYRAIDDWRKARTYQPLTIACHTRTEDVLQLALTENLADTYNLGGGSSYNFLRIAHIAEFAYKDCWHGSALELGVLQHVRLHAAACARNCLLPSDLQSEWVREHTLIKPRMAYNGNHAIVPTTPGLGIAFDHAAMQPYIKQRFEIE
ncbi:MAG: enolase C-terminal domain-like protein [Caldilineaceae bacterium]